MSKACLQSSAVAYHTSPCSIAGSDTTSIALRSIFYHLCKNPQAYAKLQNEIDSADKEGRLSSLITYDESKTLPYL